MSVSKYAKHQRSSKAKVVLTPLNGKSISFNSIDEYMNSDYRKKTMKDKKESQRASLLKSLDSD